MLVTCGYDYMSDDLNNRSYIVFVCIFDYLLPMTLVFFYYRDRFYKYPFRLNIFPTNF
jgi:hypothetical protein